MTQMLQNIHYMSSLLCITVFMAQNMTEQQELSFDSLILMDTEARMLSVFVLLCTKLFPETFSKLRRIRLSLK